MTKVQRDSSGQIVRGQTGATGAIEPAQKPATLAQLLMGMQEQLKNAMPKHLDPDRMARIALTALRTTRDLANCTQASFAGCLLSCAAMGLEPNTPLGQAWLIPRKNRKTGQTECTLQIGYQGMLDLARRSGHVASVQAFPVFDGDYFEYELGLEPRLVHKPCGSREKLTHTYAICRPKDPGAYPVFVVLTRDEIEQRRKRGADASFSPWVTDFVPMAMKSAVRALFAWIPKSAEMARAVEIEHIQERGGDIVQALPEYDVAGLLMEPESSSREPGED